MSRLGFTVVGVALLVAGAAGAVIAPTAASAKVDELSYYRGGFTVRTEIRKVEAHFTIPDIDCHDNLKDVTSDANFWIGIGGSANDSAARLGFSGSCDDGVSEYSAFWTGPQGQQAFNESTHPIDKGDKMFARIEHVGGPGHYRFTFFNDNKKHPWKFLHQASFAEGDRPTLDSASALVEAPLQSGGMYVQPLTKFIDFGFNQFLVNGKSAASFDSSDDLVAELMIAEPPFNLVLAIPTAIKKDGSFDLDHQNRGPLRTVGKQPAPTGQQTGRPAPNASY
jgi:hypothetical protein